MRKICEMLVLLMVAVMIGHPMAAFAGSSPRLIPNGAVSVLADGKEVDQFRSEMPMPQGTMMACSGSCIIQSQSLQLVARDKAVFALTEESSRWDLTVKTGRVDFAMRSEAKPVSFNTPHDTIRTKQVIVPASSGGLVRGFVSVTEKGTELSVQEGALQVVDHRGTQLVQPGHSLLLAQAVIPAAPAPAASGNAAGGGSLTQNQKIGLGVMGAGAVAIVTAAAVASSGSSGTDVSPK